MSLKLSMERPFIALAKAGAIALHVPIHYSICHSFDIVHRMLLFVLVLFVPDHAHLAIYKHTAARLCNGRNGSTCWYWLFVTNESDSRVKCGIRVRDFESRSNVTALLRDGSARELSNSTKLTFFKCASKPRQASIDLFLSHYVTWTTTEAIAPATSCPAEERHKPVER